jgi:hypothetical protein
LRFSGESTAIGEPRHEEFVKGTAAGDRFPARPRTWIHMRYESSTVFAVGLAAAGRDAALSRCARDFGARGSWRRAARSFDGTLRSSERRDARREEDHSPPVRQRFLDLRSAAER